MGPKISIIVPIYNAAELLPRCIDSVLAQTFQDFEIVLVDDGSTDNSLQICQNLATKDNRINVYHKDNGGQTSARRYGFNHSSGKYIYFVDADDFLPADALKLLNDKADEHNLDIVDGGSISYHENFTVKEKVLFEKTGEFNQLDYLKQMFANQANNGTHACLIRRSLFGEETFNIPEDVRLGEDAYIHLCLVVKAQKLGIYNFVVYYYVQSIGSITHYYEFKSLIPIKFQIENIRRVLVQYKLFEIFKEAFYHRAIVNISAACFHNRKLINDPYVAHLATEAWNEVSSIQLRLLCVFLKYPVLYPFFSSINRIRQKYEILKKNNKV